MTAAHQGLRLKILLFQLLTAALGVSGWPAEIDLAGFNPAVGLLLAVGIPLNIVWLAYAFPAADIRRAGWIGALAVLPVTLLGWAFAVFLGPLGGPFPEARLDEQPARIGHYRLYRVVAFDSDPVGILLQREIEVLPGVRIFWKVCGDTYESGGKIAQVDAQRIQVRDGERLVLDCLR